MAFYNVKTKNLEKTKLEEYHFRSEGTDRISPQVLIAQMPEIITSIPELEIPSSTSVLTIREYSTSRGAIDILMITENADIILNETKLFRNPESHRAVVAQAIDYVKAFTETEIDTLKSKFLQSKYTKSQIVDSTFQKENFHSVLNKNIRNGNFKVVIVGDKIHPNILGMVESIHSAPHLAFTIYMIELSPIKYDDENILLEPKVVENTLEIERSVIKLEIDYKNEKYTIESSVPQKDSKGSRPIITEEQYLNSLTNPELAETIKSFWRGWKNLGGDIRFGTVGFSCGFQLGGKRIPIQYVMSYMVDLISDNYRKSYAISDNAYYHYKELLKEKVPKAYDHLVANHVAMQFDTISKEELSWIFEAAIILIKKEKSN